jgi:diguanylate cyclase (GGDEF)-like protein/PAS domain S-box-containing protein
MGKRQENIQVKTYRTLIIIFASLFLIVLAYEYLRDIVFFGFTNWGSHAVIMFLLSLAGTTSGLLLLQRSKRFGQQPASCERELETTEATPRKREAPYQSLVESAEDSIYAVNKEGRYLFVNKRHRERMGLSTEGYVGKEYSAFHAPEESNYFKQEVDTVFKTGESFQCEHRSSRDNKYFLRTYSPVKSNDGTTEAVTVVSKDITRLKELEESLRSLSLTDELTGLYNRRGFLTLADQQLKLANRAQQQLYILFADVDGLKAINDRYGHQEGDAVLLKTASVLRKTFRESDVIARIGGDEFVVIILPDEKLDPDLFCVRLQKKLELFQTGQQDVYTLSLSTGIVYYDPANPVSLTELLLEADKMMYENKRRRY